MRCSKTRGIRITLVRLAVPSEFLGQIGDGLSNLVTSAKALNSQGLPWYGWHAFRRGLATNLHRLRVQDEIIQRILRHSNVSVTQACYIKTADADVVAAMRALENAPSMHLENMKKSQLM